MKTLIVYCSMHGTTEKAAAILSELIEGEVLIADLKKGGIWFDINHFDSVIIGGSIHNGTIQGSVRNFIEQNREILMTKKLGLYLCCWHGGVSGVLQFNNAFPLALREKSIASGNFGGEMLISKMGFIEKQIAGYIAGITTDTSNMDLTEINNFASKINEEVSLEVSLV